MLTDCPLGWGHEPRDSLRVLRAAVETCFWPLFEVVEGEWRLSYEPKQEVPIEEWLRGQTRFAHLLRPGSEDVVAAIQQRVDDDWVALVARCNTTRGKMKR